MRKFRHFGRFKRDIKKLSKNSHFKEKELEYIFELLLSGSDLEKRHKNHKLHGEFGDCWECHVQPDILLIYRIDKKDNVVDLVRIGSHSDLL